MPAIIGQVVRAIGASLAQVLIHAARLAQLNLPSCSRTHEHPLKGTSDSLPLFRAPVVRSAAIGRPAPVGETGPPALLVLARTVVN
jgi:hypothetical protein